MDYAQMTSFDSDDNYTFVGEGRDGWAAFPLKRSWLQITKRMREMVGSSRTMVNNCALYAWLGSQKYMDGTFAELGNVNSGGFLGLNSTSILWTAQASFEHKGPDYFFQRLMRMKVFPLSPFPRADHSIPWSEANMALYLPYGAMFRALIGTTWLLDAAPITLVPSPATAGMQTNALFKGSVYIYPVVLGQQNATAPVEAVIAVPSAEAAAGEHTHTASWSILHPGINATWQPIQVGAFIQGRYRVAVPLVRGCALIRANYTG
jgi:hypothetical protein